MNYKELAKDILKLHRPDPDVILEVAIEQQATLKQFDESFKEGCEVLAKAHAQLIEAQESEAVWKTERDKADQRRLQAEAEVERLTKLTEDCLNVIRVYCPTYYNDAMERFNKTNK